MKMEMTLRVRVCSALMAIATSAILPDVGFTAEPAARRSDHPLRSACVEYLSKEGFRPEVDADGDVAFKCEGVTFLVRLLSDDEGFIRIEYYMAKAKDADEALRCLIAANHVNSNTKLGKAYLVNDGVLCFGADLSVKDIQSVPGMLERGISVVQTVRQMFLSEFNKEVKGTSEVTAASPKQGKNA